MPLKGKLTPLYYFGIFHICLLLWSLLSMKWALINSFVIKLQLSIFMKDDTLNKAFMFSNFAYIWDKIFKIKLLYVIISFSGKLSLMTILSHMTSYSEVHHYYHYHQCYYWFICLKLKTNKSLKCSNDGKRTL